MSVHKSTYYVPRWLQNTQILICIHMQVFTPRYVFYPDMNMYIVSIPYVDVWADRYIIDRSVDRSKYRPINNIRNSDRFCVDMHRRTYQRSAQLTLSCSAARRAPLLRRADPARDVRPRSQTPPNQKNCARFLRGPPRCRTPSLGRTRPRI
jgi:hypothetical protein